VPFLRLLIIGVPTEKFDIDQREAYGRPGIYVTSDDRTTGGVGPTIGSSGDEVVEEIEEEESDEPEGGAAERCEERGETEFEEVAADLQPVEISAVTRRISFTSKFSRTD